MGISLLTVRHLLTIILRSLSAFHHDARRLRQVNRSDNADVQAQVTLPSGIASEDDQVEINNAILRTNKEVSTRFDREGSDSRVEHKGMVQTLHADNEFKCGPNGNWSDWR
jgi:hypothetical protein